MSLFGLKIYTVHLKPGQSQLEQKPIFVHEGFNIKAFILVIFWTLYHRLWLASFLLIVVNTVLIGMRDMHILSDVGVFIMQFGVQIITGFLANDWYRHKLDRQGYIIADISAADSLLRAEQRYFERTLAAA